VVWPLGNDAFANRPEPALPVMPPMMAVFDVAPPVNVNPENCAMLFGATCTGRELPVWFGLATGA